jgi:hypothetical protein
MLIRIEVTVENGSDTRAVQYGIKTTTQFQHNHTKEQCVCKKWFLWVVVVLDKKQYPEQLLAYKLKTSSKPKKHPKNSTEKSCSPPNNQQQPRSNRPQGSISFPL